MDKHNNLIQLLKSKDEKAIHDFYLENKNGFILFAKRYNLAQEDVIDVYQDAIIALVENAKRGKLDTLQCSVTTYFFSIGKFMVFQKLKKRKINFAAEDLTNLEYLDEEYKEEELNLQVALLQKGLAKLGEQCRKVLQLFYYEEKKLDEIQVELGYSSKDVLKSQKSRCLKQLKDLTKEN